MLKQLKFVTIVAVLAYLNMIHNYASAEPVCTLKDRMGNCVLLVEKSVSEAK